jgi:hypothetical protein
MTTLIQRCTTANADLERVEIARRNASARALIQQRAKEWEEHLVNLNAARERAVWMALTRAELSAMVACLNQLRRNAAEALARLKAGEDVSTLTSDSLWTRLLQSTEGVTNALDDAVKIAWRGFLEAQGSLSAPSDLQSQLPSTPTNVQALSAYRAAYATYGKLAAQQMPRSAEDKASLLAALAACRAEMAKMQHDVPADVEAFFRAVYSNSATLASLTPGVLQWLADNGQLHRYLVRSALQ